MKAFLYILQSNSGRYYIGSTNDLKRRLDQHARGHTSTSKRLNTTRLVFFQEFSSLVDARKQEQKIKRWKRKDFIDKIVRDGTITSEV